MLFWNSYKSLLGPKLMQKLKALISLLLPNFSQNVRGQRKDNINMWSLATIMGLQMEASPCQPEPAAYHSGTPGKSMPPGLCRHWGTSSQILESLYAPKDADRHIWWFSEAPKQVRCLSPIDFQKEERDNSVGQFEWVLPVRLHEIQGLIPYHNTNILYLLSSPHARFKKIPSDTSNRVQQGCL